MPLKTIYFIQMLTLGFLTSLAFIVIKLNSEVNKNRDVNVAQSAVLETLEKKTAPR